MLSKLVALAKPMMVKFSHAWHTC